MHTFVFNTVLFSIICHYDYLPFGPTKAGGYDESAALLDYFNLHHLGNCYLLGREFVSLYLSVVGLHTRFLISIELIPLVWWQQMLMWETPLVQFAKQALTGWRCIPLIDSPLYAKTIPSGKIDFVHSIHQHQLFYYNLIHFRSSEFWSKRWNTVVHALLKVPCPVLHLLRSNAA